MPTLKAPLPPTDEEVIDCLKRAFVDDKMPAIMIDGDVLNRQPFLGYVALRGRELGLLDWGHLIEGDQWSWYSGKLTEKGKQAVGLETS